jgi:hypothetical protein
MKRFAILLALFGAVPAAAKDVPSNTPEARQALEAYGRCVAQRSPRESKRVISMDFTTTDYRTGLRLLATSMAKDCAHDSFGEGALRGGNLLMAGAIAEGLIEANPGPVNVRLAHATSTQIKTYAPTDAIAQCLSRSLPDQVAGLLGATPGSDAEIAAAAPLSAAIPACARAADATDRLDIAVPALRAMIATAAFRLLAAQGS